MLNLHDKAHPGHRSEGLILIILGLVLVFGLCSWAEGAREDLERGLEKHSTLKLPSGPGPFPGLVLMSGCRGVGPTQQDWAARLTGRGYACLIVDSMRPRGFSGGVCEKPLSVSPYQRADDAWWGFSFLGRQPKVDRSRLGLIGWSHGGWAALTALAVKRKPAGGGFKAAVAVYPYCGLAMPERISAPLLILLGGKDDICPPQLCLSLAERLKKAGDSVRTHVFPEARHGFDRPDLPEVLSFLRGTAGYHEESSQKARIMVREFFKTHLEK